MDFSPNTNKNQMDDEKTTIKMRKKYWEGGVLIETKNGSDRQTEDVQKRRSSSVAEEEKIPEIKDIYDHIYGNVQSKLQFYETRQDRSITERKDSAGSATLSFISDNVIDNQEDHDNINKTKLAASKNALSTEEDDFDEEVFRVSQDIHAQKLLDDSFFAIPEAANANNDIKELQKGSASKEKVISEPISHNTIFQEVQLKEVGKETFNTEDDFKTEDRPSTPTPVNSPVLEKKNIQHRVKPAIQKDLERPCTNCSNADFVTDRSEVLTEINANLKLELESVKRDLKKELVKNNELNFEIANIENSLETYYNEARGQKSTFSSIYSAMKHYVSEQKNDFDEGYTYKRIQMIADYMESLKSKLEHQDRIIKNNFIENPYYTDLIIRHEAVLGQLDNMSKAHQIQQEEIKKNSSEELEIIKELNRQKFQIENRCRDMEQYYRNEIITKEALIKSVEDEYKKQLEDYQNLLDQRDEEMAKIQRNAAARINNYKQELVIVYRKWKDQKKLNAQK